MTGMKVEKADSNRGDVHSQVRRYPAYRIGSDTWGRVAPTNSGISRVVVFGRLSALR